MRSRRAFLLVCICCAYFLAHAPIQANADEWQPISPAELQMTATFAQREIRYVGLELGIGGYQPHPASQIFAHRYGDCKDKATLVSAMLTETGVESYHVVINSERGAVTTGTPPQIGIFNHMILAIKLPEGVSDPSLVDFLNDTKLGKLLIFDPTDEMTPFGQLRGALQANYGLLVNSSGDNWWNCRNCPPR